MAPRELETRRLDAVRAWSSFVESGDGAETLVRPEILTSWTRSHAAITPDVLEAPLANLPPPDADANSTARGVPTLDLNSPMRRS